MKFEHICLLLAILGQAASYDEYDQVGKPITDEDCGEADEGLKFRADDEEPEFDPDDDPTAEDQIPTLRNRNAVLGSENIWPNGIIPYEISPGFDARGRRAMCLAMKKYERHTCIMFKAREKEADSVYFTELPYNVCSSYVGRQGGKQIVTLGSICHSKGVIMHEMMHIVGFHHEHMRPDRDCYITIDFTNIKDGKELNYRVCDWDECQTLNTPYDYGSILHYNPYSFAKLRKYPVIVPKVPGAKGMGQRRDFSEIDVLKILRLYCKGNETMYEPLGSGDSRASKNTHILMGAWNILMLIIVHLRWL